MITVDDSCVINDRAVTSPVGYTLQLLFISPESD